MGGNGTNYNSNASMVKCSHSRIFPPNEGNDDDDDDDDDDDASLRPINI